MSNASVGQVVVNPEALSHLTPSAPAASAPATQSHPPARERHHPPARRAASSEKKPAARASTSRASVKPPAFAPAPPPAVALAPAVTAPPKPTPPPPPVPVVADATGLVSPLSNGARITFGATSSDLNPAMVDAIRSVARAMDATAGSEVSLYAYSSGPADDPSTPRRLALQRALAVRAVLISEGSPRPGFTRGCSRRPRPQPIRPPLRPSHPTGWTW